MEPSQVVADLRIVLDDSVRDYLWSDQELASFIAEGYRAFARDTRSLIDMSTPSVATYSVPADSYSVAVSPLIVEIMRAVDTTNDNELTLENSNMVPFTGIPKGIPRAMIADRESGKLHFYPIPATDFSLTLQVARYPIEDFSTNMATSLEYQDIRAWRIINLFATQRAYLKDDVETQDMVRASTFKSLYDEEVLNYTSDFRRATRTVGIVSYGGY